MPALLSRPFKIEKWWTKPNYVEKWSRIEVSLSKTKSRFVGRFLQRSTRGTKHHEESIKKKNRAHFETPTFYNVQLCSHTHDDLFILKIIKTQFVFVIFALTLIIWFLHLLNCWNNPPVICLIANFLCCSVSAWIKSANPLKRVISDEIFVYLIPTGWLQKNGSL